MNPGGPSSGMGTKPRRRKESGASCRPVTSQLADLGQGLESPGLDFPVSRGCGSGAAGGWEEQLMSPVTDGWVKWEYGWPDSVTVQGGVQTDSHLGSFLVYLSF